MDASSPDDLIDTLRLSLVYGVGPKTRKALLERFGTAGAVLAAAMSDLREVTGVGAKLAHSIADADQIDAARSPCAASTASTSLPNRTPPTPARYARSTTRPASCSSAAS